jgi:hypothetical protein
MNKTEVKQALKPLYDVLKTLEDQFCVNVRIVEAEWIDSLTSFDPALHARILDNSYSDRITVDIRLCHDAINDTRDLSLVSADCLAPPPKKGQPYIPPRKQEQAAQGGG